MEDYTVQGLEARIQSLCISNENKTYHPRQSLVADPLFQHFYNKSRIEERGYTHFERVVKFQESISLYAILDSDVFIEVVKASEPGRPLSYQSLKVDFMKVQDEIQGNGAVIQGMFDFFQELKAKHRHFVKTSCALTMVELYNKIIVRQYGVVQDHEFSALPEFQSLSYAVCFRDEAPPYAEVRANLDDTIAHLQWILKHAAQSIATIKNSLEFKKFRAKLTTAQQAHQLKLERSAKAAQRAAYVTSLDFIRRLAETKMKNEKMQERRAKKNLSLKSINIESLHQLGNQTRTPLPNNVVQALSVMQSLHNDAISAELNGGSSSTEKWKKDSVDNRIGEENIHNAVENLTINGEPEDFKEDVEIPNGFENVATSSSTHVY